MKTFYTDRGGEFIVTKLKNICKKKGMTIKYIPSYMHKKNGLSE